MENTVPVKNGVGARRLKRGKLTAAVPMLTVLAALELLAVLLLQGQLSFQLSNASLRQLPAKLLVLLNQHSALGHQLLPGLAARETGLTSHSEPRHEAEHPPIQRAMTGFDYQETQTKTYEVFSVS